jgi:hypothetical protein
MSGYFSSRMRCWIFRKASNSSKYENFRIIPRQGVSKIPDSDLASSISLLKEGK